MRLAAFFSGGKDSTFAIYSAKKHGHTVEVLLTLFPKSDESHLLPVSYTHLRAHET